ALDLGAAQAMTLAKLEAAVEARVDDEAAGIRLVGVAQELVVLPEPCGERRRVGRSRKHVDETARALERGLRAGEAPLGEERGGEAALRGAPGVEALAHAAEHLANPGRLRRGGAERPRGAHLVEPEEARARGGRADDAGGAGDVPADRVMGR